MNKNESARDKMVKAKFTDIMLSKFKKLKGSRLIYYLTDDINGGDISYCKIGIETDNGCLDVYNEETPVDWFDTEGEKAKEDISVFSCKERKNSEEFIPYISDSGIIKHNVNELINSIKIVSDYIKVNNGEYSIDCDIAIIIQTDSHEYIFSRGWFFSEEIYVSVDSDINNIYSVDDEIKAWNNDGDYSVEIQRIVKEI